MEKKDDRKKPSATGSGEKQGGCIILRKGEVLRSKSGGQNPVRPQSGRKEQVKEALSDKAYRQEGGDGNEDR